MQEQLAHQEIYYQDVISRQDESRALWHDIKKYMLAMENLVSKNDQSEAQNQLTTLKNKFSNLEQLVYTGNSIADGILNYGSNKAQSLGISINFDLWLDTELNISPVDLYIIIGNTMDNAIEACDAFPAGQKQSISCTLRQKNHVLLYEISNPIPQVSVKKAGDIHGYGLENVKECVNRNNGFISVKTENDTFCVSITLNV
ncbi:ATP-binding protein [Agathobacter sp.]